MHTHTRQQDTMQAYQCSRSSAVSARMKHVVVVDDCARCGQAAVPVIIEREGREASIDASREEIYFWTG